MSERPSRRGFASRPGAAETWIKAPDAALGRKTENAAFTARLTIDVTPEMRGRIKVAAFTRSVTVADMLRELFNREFPPAAGESR